MVRAAWLPESLLVRFECSDVDAWGTHLARDAPLWEEEAVEVFLAPGETTPRRYVELEVSPRGALFDAWIANPDGRRETMTADLSWDCPGLRWDVGLQPATADSSDWWAEIEVPLRELLPDSAKIPGSWRANFFRIERPRRGRLPEEFSAWSPTWRDPPDFHVPTCFGTVRRRDTTARTGEPRDDGGGTEDRSRKGQ